MRFPKLSSDDFFRTTADLSREKSRSQWQVQGGTEGVVREQC